MNQLIDFILIGGIFTTLLILFLLIKSNKKLPQKLLVVFFATILLYLLHGYAQIHDIPFLFVLTFIFNDCTEILLGPIVFLYIKSLFEDNKTLIKKNWGHFVLTFLLIAFVSIPFLISVLTNEYLFGYLRYLNENSLLGSILMSFVLITYIVMSLKLFSKYRNAMLDNFSTIDDNDFSWVKKMLVGTLIVVIVDTLITIYEFFTVEFPWDSEHITAFLVIILIGYLGYYGINQSKVLLPDFLIQSLPDKSKDEGKSIQASRLGDAESKELRTALETVLLEEKAYLDEELTLGKLAQMVGTTDKKLSGLLNQQMNTTFYDLINRYRVDSVKEKLNSGEFENMTLLGIAFESGFKSKTSFNRIFKRETGLSPSQYKKKR